jgi:outer membrane lipoprotein SlyB
MKLTYTTLLVSISALTLVTACGSNPPSTPSTVGNAYGTVTPAGVYYGYVTRIDVVSVSSRTSGGGAVLGAVLGAVIGHQVGSGTGQDVATGVGAIGGAVIGNRIESRRSRDDEVYRVSVRREDGRVEQFDYQQINDLRTGDRVKVEGGQLYRM